MYYFLLRSREKVYSLYESQQELVRNLIVMNAQVINGLGVLIFRYVSSFYLANSVLFQSILSIFICFTSKMFRYMQSITNYKYILRFIGEGHIVSVDIIYIYLFYIKNVSIYVIYYKLQVYFAFYWGRARWFIINISIFIYWLILYSMSKILYLMSNFFALYRYIGQIRKVQYSYMRINLQLIEINLYLNTTTRIFGEMYRLFIRRIQQGIVWSQNRQKLNIF
eukprot:TRINITY_DN11488_c0_g2_i2.p1 TRINITY_DN11488_c0_g2~~TRINITY_DN11488_c0_g2_i2.p1  ORF type:complete len:223 (-),score=-32.60 TRINITY_DN11488_c0_g2_i2:588-1256(-)